MRLVAEIEVQARRGFIKTQEQFLLALERAIETSLRSGNSDPRFVRAEIGAGARDLVGVDEASERARLCGVL